MNTLTNILIWVIIAVYLMFALGFAENKTANLVCNKINVEILDSISNQFITNEDVLEMLRESEAKILGYPFSEINTLALQENIKGNPMIKETIIYKTIDGILNIDIVQRKPIMRVINAENQHYYIDEEGSIIPWSGRFTSHALVVNGRIPAYKMGNPVNDIYSMVEGYPNKVLIDLFELAKFIYQDQFWKAQICQVYVNDKYEFELIPRVGAHVIQFGTIDDYQQKFRKLNALYLSGFNNVGWNKYETINLKYKNQVICTKR